MAATRSERIQLIQAMQERLYRESRSDLLRFTLATMPTFRPADFHRRYYHVLSKFADGGVKKLMVFMPPQHGKSEGSTRRLPAFLLGQDPEKRLAIVSYNAQRRASSTAKSNVSLTRPNIMPFSPERA